MSYRANRLAGEIKRVVTELLQTGLKDPRIHRLTSVIAVEVSKDCRYAKIYVSVLGSEEEQLKTLEGLQSASGFIRSELGKQIRLRYHPEILFVLDDSIEHSMKINEMLRKLKSDKRLED
ncbi:MAG: 30S ribosome-binding factor RbfA [Syntrophaceticus sp.]